MAKGKYHDWLEPDSLLLLKSWARDGLTDKEIADKIDISKGTFYEWLKKYKDFSDAIKKGRRPVEVEVEDSFIKQLMGYYVDEELTEITRDGNGNVISQHGRKTKRYIPPNPTLLIFFLKNKKSDKYRDKPNFDSSSEVLGKLDDVLKNIKGIE